MDKKDYDELINKRKFFRVYSNNPICTEISIVNVKGKSIKTNPSNICVKDIGFGGLRFSSKLALPVEEDIIYKFKIPILHKCYHIRGTIVWRSETKGNNACYGVNFLLDENNNSDCFNIFNTLALTIKRNSPNHGCNFCNTLECPNKDS
jgi:hypothetical protein